MGDYTVREVLRRRSAETLRKIQQRRDQHKRPEGESSSFGWLIAAVLLLAPPLGYAWWVADATLAQGIGGGPRNTQIFMRPLVLVAGAPIGQLALREELGLLGYRPQIGEAELVAGQFRVEPDSVTVSTRGFAFDGSVEPERALVVRFEGERVAVIESDGSALKRARLEPVLLGSIVPVGAPERVPLRGDEIPDRVRRMVVAALDPAMVTRGTFGAAFDERSILRRYAAIKLEGSTRPWARSFDPQIVAIALGWRARPSQVLEALINEAHITTEGSRDVHGFGLGANFLFGKTLVALESHEVALLVALLEAGGRIDPRNDPASARTARDAVLDAAAVGDALVAADAEVAKLRDLEVLPQAPTSTAFDRDLIQLVQAELMRDFVASGDALPSGMRVFTSLDPRIQRLARAALTGARERGALGADTEGSMVVAEHELGNLLAAVGGLAVARQINLAVDNIRPIGPLALPATYLASMDSGYGPLTTVDDSPLEVELPGGAVWAPRNADGRSHGREPLIFALAGAHVIALSRVALDIGVPNVVDALRRLGVPRAVEAHPAIAGGEVLLSPLEVTQVYATAIQGGKRAPLHAVVSVRDGDGNTLARRRAVTPTRSGQERDGYLLVRALQQVAHSAAWRGAMPARAEAAAMAGVDGGGRDAWAAGGDGMRVATVWFGRKDAGFGPGAAGAAAAALGDVLDTIGAVPLAASRPAGVSEVWVDPDSGSAVGASCPGAVQLAFPVALAPPATTECRGGANAALRRLLGSGSR